MKFLKLLMPTLLLAVVPFTVSTAASPQKILILGDSLSAEYGLKKGEGWVALMQKRMEEKNIPAQIHNASISGETTSGGRSRIDSLLTNQKPTIVIVELGANDAIRGLPLKNTQENLNYIVKKSLDSKARVLLVGMQVPPNFGGAYGREFSNVFSQVAKENKIASVEFFLKNVADIPDALNLFQADRAHPNAKAHPIMLENVWPQLEPLLKN